MWIKLCGIRDCATAGLAAELGVDAVGLNFYAPSPRSVSLATARPIAEALRRTGTEPVGLFVNHPLEQIEEAVEACRLPIVQLHGDEPPEFVFQVAERLPDVRLIRAFRVGDEGCGAIADALAEYERHGVRLWGCLIDAKVGGAYGGTGHTAPWNLLRREYSFGTWPRLILAGGLHPENVAAAMTAVGPWGIDVSSGIEASPGVKDPARMREFVASARGL